MNKELSHRIRERAHSIWEDEGRPSGRADAHWSLASAQLAAETGRPAAAKPAGRKSVAAASTAAKRVSETTAAAPKPRKTAPRA